jgi:hypothetical protein
LVAALEAIDQEPFSLAQGLGDAVAVPVPYTLSAQGITYAADLSGAMSLFDAGVALHETFSALARVARCLAALHDRGTIHGDLRPELVLIDSKRWVGVLTPSRMSAPGAVLRTRLLYGGAALTAMSFAAPEVVAAEETTPASDVYSLAAMAYVALTGRAPLGQLNLHTQGAAPPGPHTALVHVLASALDEAPARRPVMVSLASALEAAAHVAYEGGAQGAPYRAPVAAPASVFNAPSPSRETSPILAFTLIAGGVFTFFGAVMLAAIGWAVTGALGRVMLLGTLAAAAWGLGRLASRRALASAATVAYVGSGIFATVALAFAFSQLDALGRLGLLVALTVGVSAGAAFSERRQAPVSSLVLLALATQLLWTLGAQVLHMTHALRDEGAVALIAALVSAVTYVTALARRAPLLSALSAFDVAIATGALGLYLRTGTTMGPAYYSFAVALFYALLSVIATWRKPDTLAAPFALAFGLCAAASVLSGLSVMRDASNTTEQIGALWPYLVGVAMVALTQTKPPTANVATLVAGAVVVMVPTIEAFSIDTPAAVALALLIGGCSLAAALFWPRLRHADDVRTEALYAALAGVLVSPDLRLLRVMVRRADQGDASAVWWALVVVPSLALLALARAVTGRISRDNHRLLEVAGVAPLLGVLTLQSLNEMRSWVYAALALGVSVIFSAYGALSRRAAVFVVASAAIVLNVCIQYFVRLEWLFPLSIRLVGFGVGLLVAGVLYEQQLKHRVTRLRNWA